MTRFAELGVTSNFSFLRSGSHPDELVHQAAALGHEAVGIADRNTLAGVVRAHMAAKEAGIQLVVGARLVTQDGFELLCFPRDRAAYGRLSKLLTLGNRRAPKGECHLSLADIAGAQDGQVLVVMPPAQVDAAFEARLREAMALLDIPYLAAGFLYGADDRARLTRLAALAEGLGLRLMASNDVHYHAPQRRALQDVVTAIREHVRVEDAGALLAANAERHLKPPEEMARLFAAWPDAITATVDLAKSISFSMDELAYQYPDEVFGKGETPQETLERLTWEHAQTRFPDGPDPEMEQALRHELELIARLDYAPYFLTVYDIVRFARSQGILCQGRGSAANSCVCFCLGITSINPVEINLLFERFISAERNEPPDIDVDFEHERREEVIQYIYEKYGRHRAGLAATVISYRSRSSIREVGKVMGLSEDVTAALSGTTWGWSSSGIDPDHVREQGLDPTDHTLMLALELSRELIGFPRHLSQHVGGFVITAGPLEEVMPIANAAMEDRTFVEWDKDDLSALGMLKIDVLALGMLSCIRRAFAFLDEHYDRPLDLASLPPEDPQVYDMLCKADSIGVFQVESRAQMSMLPRLKPRKFYDLVIEVAIVRPGPIQGDMVHPYLRRRDGIEDVTYPSKELEAVLGKTMGVPLFQEQAMRIAIVAAGFTPSEADGLRRAMATFRKVGTIHSFQAKLVEGMVERGYERDFAERCFKQIEGFGEYGFPESHAASFALLVYVSAWLKWHYPDVFCAAILNAQPLGFYAPAQLVRDAREHGVEMRAPDINASDWDATLEAREGARAVSAEGGGRMAVRLGLRQIKGFRVEAAEKLMAARPEQGFDSVRDLWLKTRLTPAELERLAKADAFRSLELDRREALWAVRGLGGATRKMPATLPLFAHAEGTGFQHEEEVPLPAMPLGEHVVEDYTHMRLSLKAHPLSFLRGELTAARYITSAELPRTRNDAQVSLAGLVLVRQRPGSAKGVIFATLEDEFGAANIIVWPPVFETYRKVVLGARVLGVRGRLQRQGQVIHIVADHLEDLTHMLGALSLGEGIGDAALANADEVRRPGEDPRAITARRQDARAARAEQIEQQFRQRPKEMPRATRQSVQQAAARMIPKSRDFH
ncbi:DNA polymerase III subunit alpha [Pyruvatibacter mobilis]|uniref:Error-prone DNA polymerase n=1 Tax=Pyruvatibacter mobilis TaxID=1712261 RepID=A0A845QE29_9HYPH|nr:error-prone DNA polymerase [Pyruvatibacter mobilis]NBG96496.1 DNA polymerase III subunit alpha [Pyruvatibacter mobilis]QJD74613.1 error-prone DNA polymerase [Pyruvatibacter mobilis]GGD08651.1 error-prone DNA polymerase [Pyruvatibacter mobilis]